MTIIPEVNDPDFIALEAKINSEFETSYIETNIRLGSKVKDCFNIVKKQVDELGGLMILGWQVWKHTNLIEAEAHAVWEENPDQDLIDISPKEGIIVHKILFIENPRLKYEGKQINSIRLNITANPLIDHFIQLSDLFFHYRNKGNRANYHDLSEMLNDEEISEIVRIDNWKNKA